MGHVHKVEFRTARQLTLEDLPTRGNMYWCDRQKADVVAAVRSGLLTFEQASEWYMLSAEEFITWLKLDYVGRSAKRGFAPHRKVSRLDHIDVNEHPAHATAH